ncbi:bifunctional diguanylate cyclase/phosphodiesterase [Massilia sp. IC2-476]|uniref:putative bifunctional diguanylate cyclase/phosphodiesterase n=1 Tax=Massilia sp. IC2-476 TaxID=2887199 RepID=UPI001D11E212|nr:bifunctional diguanylate cyclase/phosphodiesterase [Massilia sp. IC2-476]MCC2974426.1 bifunctional diguanylate cyclase/phosphodiesterase [Massilia sp. IC2-476]
MKIVDTYFRLRSGKGKSGWLMLPVLLLMVVGVYSLVHATGGIKYVYSHSMYIPVMLAGLCYGWSGGILIAVIAGIALGPLMPIEVVTGEPQKAANWLFRTGFFLFVGVLSGIASNAALAQVRKLQWMTRHDPATGLPNLTALLDALGAGDANPSGFARRALAVMSIRNAPELRTVFGVAVVEENMTQLAGRALGSLPPGARVFRVSSEQLAVLFEDPEGASADTLARVGAAFQLPFLYREVPLHLDVLVGYVVLADAGVAPQDYLRRAQSATFHAFETGSEIAHYQVQLHDRTRDSLAILSGLRIALERRELLLHYQPKVCLRTGTVRGVEALMRWNHRERGLIGPAVFIERAEQSTLIHALTAFALETALGQALQWQAQGIDLPVAVNISSRNLAHPDFARRILDTLARCGAAPRLLELEVTESSLMLDVARTTAELQLLARQGVRVAIDDFGTGYSSLAYVQRLPVSHLKIDRSFVSDLMSSPDSQHIVETVVSLARKIGLQTIAEGVEDAATYERLQSLGCDMAQGFYLARPMPADALPAWLEAFDSKISRIPA